MQFFFTEEDYPTNVRSSEIRMALTVAHHKVIHGRLGETPPPGTDVWMHGLGVDGAPPLDDAFSRKLIDSKAEVVLFQLCDAPNMSFYRLAPDLVSRTRLFLRNHWPKGDRDIPEACQDRIGFLPPMIKFMSGTRGTSLANRSQGCVFFGTRTGRSNMGAGKNAREQAVRIMRASGLPFTGGLVAHPEYQTDPALLVPKIRDRHHRRLLLDAKICLAAWGNHPLTYRMFEGMAMRCLVLAQTIRDTRFLDAGLEPGRHYVELAADLGDLVATVDYFLKHLDEAQAIADAGHEHFARYFQSRGRIVSSWIFDATVASWKDLYRPSIDRSPLTWAKSSWARLFPEH